MIIFATGFDAVDGNYTRLRIHGRGGESLADHWRTDSSSCLGVAVSNFPNLFMLAGPKGPFTNIPPALEAHVEIVAELIEHGHGGATIEATPQAEAGWSKVCEDLATNSLFKRASSWIFGANVPGKNKSTLFFFGGLANFWQQWAEIVKDGYRGFTFTPLKDAVKITSRQMELTSPAVPYAYNRSKM